jgi:hypothetical protein
MDAKELHDLYAPLWARVPETRPTGLWCFDYEDGHRFETTPALWDFADLDNPANAALCRVAVEDWLRAKAYGVLELSSFNEVRIADRGHGGSVSRYSGPTIHHALVAAAHALQDVLAASQGEVGRQGGPDLRRGRPVGRQRPPPCQAASPRTRPPRRRWRTSGRPRRSGPRR